VWAKFNNLHPWWPGIIADESARAQNPQEKQPRTVLVNFFGDNSWGWVKDKDLLPFFDERYEKLRDNMSNLGQSSRTKIFAKALQQAKELHEVDTKTIRNGDVCWKCMRGGLLLCCDLCPTEFCFSCLGLAEDAAIEV